MRITGIHPAPLTRKECRDLRTLGQFIGLRCRLQHREAEREPFTLSDADPQSIFGRRPPRLCPECTALLQHGTAKRLLCPLDPKPMCKQCPTPCYSNAHRRAVREVMRFSGPRMILRGRLHHLLHLS